MSKPAVINAADPRQVRTAERLERRRLARFGDSLRAVLATPAGRAVLWGLLERAGVYRSVWDPSAKIHYNAGRQDFGHELLATICAADEAAYMLMESEARAQMRADTRETDAGHMTSIAEGEQS